MTTITTLATGCIVCGDTAIWGIGSSEAAAWADMLDSMESAGITIVDELAVDANGETDPNQSLKSDFKIVWATQALLDQVAAQGGNTSWSEVNGIACTRAEKDEA